MVGCFYQVQGEFLTGNTSSQFMFLGSPTKLLIDCMLVAIAFTLYRQRKKIIVGRQPDIDYDTTEAFLHRYESAFEQKLKNDKMSDMEKQKVKDCLKSVKSDRENWEKGTKSQYEISLNYNKYEKEIGDVPIEKDLVFISYSHFDEKYARYLTERVEKEKIKVWNFKCGMKADKQTNDYAVAIRRALKRARIFVVIISKNSMMSEHVKNEICLAFNEIPRGTVLLPILVENVSISDDEMIEYFLCRQDITDAINPPVKKQLNEFVEKIRCIF